MTLIIVYFSGRGRAADEVGTKAFINSLPPKIDVAAYQRWDKSLYEWWAYPEDIIVMEHDVVPTMPMLFSMLNCTRPACTQTYRLYKASTNLDREVYGHRILTFKDDLRFCEIGEKIEFADAASLCFTKFSAGFRAKLDREAIFRDKTTDLVNLDHKISLAAIAAGLKFHVHTPEMKHNHTTALNDWHDTHKTYLGIK
jgi:hypothetical protein